MNFLEQAEDTTRAGEAMHIDRVIAQLRASGWIICAPGHVHLPRNRPEAEAMNLVSERWLRDNPK